LSHLGPYYWHFHNKFKLYRIDIITFSSISIFNVLLCFRPYCESVFLAGSVLSLVFVVVLVCVFEFCVPCCDVRYDFSMETTFGSSHPPAVCRSVHISFTLFVFVCIWWRATHIVLCFALFVLPMLPITLYCPSEFYNVDLRLNLFSDHLVFDEIGEYLSIVVSFLHIWANNACLN
jgi:hypothetical protein